MDVSAARGRARVPRHGVARMIHGHTHRPARHHLTVVGTAPASAWCSPTGTTAAASSRSTPAGIAARALPPA